MIKVKKIRAGKRFVEALWVKLQSKNFILLRGARGYVMCGYLNLKAAEKFKDTAVKITGASTIEEALRTRVASCTSPARRLGIYKGQPIKEVLKIIA
ncbi:MAG: hypothetical protein A3J51_01745 [Omnitrophica WOR_2 bacterium RIFCSPHIGHO2_02_FULL_45_21]|nr:MAG: hypothetical protein A3J51_01745 [Omnitrophica WOR_2 bacterium RIFCSPHIGHO2_02_FULL_45_21]